MGNKSSSTLLSIQEDLTSRASTRNNSFNDATLLQLQGIIEIVQAYAVDAAKLTAKDIKTLSSITSLLSTEFGRVSKPPYSPLVIACKLKAVAAIFRLLHIPGVSKIAFESCAMGLVNSLDHHHKALLTLALHCICTCTVNIEDDAIKRAVCARLERYLFYERMLRIMDTLAKRFQDTVTSGSVSGSGSGSGSGLLPAVLTYCQHLIWLLSMTISPSTTSTIASEIKSFQTRLVDKILKHQDSLFILTRYYDNPINFAATMLLIKVFTFQDRKQCSVIQVD